MKKAIMVRRLDTLGRLVIPQEARKKLGVQPGDELELTMEADGLFIRKFTPGCIFCGNTEGLTSFEEKQICQQCLTRLRKV